MRQFDQCADIAGEPARRWRWPLADIVKDPGKECRRGLTDGLRDFVEVDNERALDVGYAEARALLKFGSRKLQKGARM